MRDFIKTLRGSFRDKEYAEIYADSFQDTYLATQVKVLREQRGLSQAELGVLIGTTQGGVSRIEDANYSSWSVKTLKKLARALGVRLRISYEEYGTLPDQVMGMNRESLMRSAHENDVALFPEKISSDALNNLRSIGERRDKQELASGETMDETNEDFSVEMNYRGLDNVANSGESCYG